MTNPIGAIGAGYTQGIQPRQPKEDNQQEVKQELKEQQAQQSQESLVDADKTLEYMAQQSSVMLNKPVQSVKTINVSHYVTPEQAQRIAGFVTGFVDEVADNFNATKQEFPEMSDNIAMVIALSQFESDNY